MAMSVNPAIEGNPPLSSGHCDPAAMVEASIHGSHQGRGHVVPQQQAVHMTASDLRLPTRGNSLRAGGHPHMTALTGHCEDPRA